MFSGFFWGFWRILSACYECFMRVDGSWVCLLDHGLQGFSVFRTQAFDVGLRALRDQLRLHSTTAPPLRVMGLDCRIREAHPKNIMLRYPRNSSIGTCSLKRRVVEELFLEDQKTLKSKGQAL